MCKSTSDGGQRCAAHTRPAFQRALNGLPDTAAPAQFDEAAIEHATTPTGREEVVALLATAATPQMLTRLETILVQADRTRAQRREVEAEVQRMQAAANNTVPDGPVPLTWAEVQAKHPLYSATSYGFDHGVNELAHSDDGIDVTQQNLVYTEQAFDTADVRFQRYPADDARVQSALQGYRDGADVPPVLLVNRAGENFTVDGHHRLTAAELLGLPISAVVAHSPRTEPYAGRVGIGYTLNGQSRKRSR